MTQTIELQEIQALGDELLGTIAMRWIELDQDLSVWEESDTGICTDRVRQIGEQINRFGGLSMLMAVRSEIEERCMKFSPDFAQVFNTEINWVWNGIGGWQA
jgi:hypothetical protein